MLPGAIHFPSSQTNPNAGTGRGQLNEAGMGLGGGSMQGVTEMGSKVLSVQSMVLQTLHWSVQFPVAGHTLTL